MMDKLLRWNAEFAKNIWLEYSVQRMIAMPAVILLIVLLIFVNARSAEDGFKTLRYVSVGGFVFIGMLWGVKSASNSILDEYNEKTWDWQKMSIIGAWKLVIGKLFGSTIYNWYGALICLFFYLFSALRLGTLSTALTNAYMFIVAAVSLHGLIILLALQLIKQADGRSKVKSNRIVVGGFIFFYCLSSIAGYSFLNDSEIDVSVSWFGISTSMNIMKIIGSTFYCAWIVAGLYRSMRAELQYSDTPNWWTAFIMSSFLFQIGFFFGYETLSPMAGLTLGTFIYFVELLIIVYFLALTEVKDVVNFRLLQNAFKQKSWTHFFQNIPLWLLTLPIAFAFGILTLFLFIIIKPSEADRSMLDGLDIHGTGIGIAFLLSLFGFIIRDLGVLLLLHFSPKARRANTAMFFYILVIYIILPLLLGGNSGLGSAFYPNIMAPPIVMVIFPWIEAAIVLWFLRAKWNKLSIDE